MSDNIGKHYYVLIRIDMADGSQQDVGAVFASPSQPVRITVIQLTQGKEPVSYESRPMDTHKQWRP